MKAKFYYFKASGKFYSDGEGNVPHSDEVWSRQQLLACNDWKMPGLASAGEGFTVVVVPEGSYGWPQLKLPHKPKIASSNLAPATRVLKVCRTGPS